MLNKLEKIIEKSNSKIVKKTNTNPKVIIFGEEHRLNKNLLNLEHAFKIIKPKYLFCEGCTYNETLNLESYYSYLDSNSQSRNSFANYINYLKNNNSINNFGNVAQAIDKNWILHNQETTFIGIDLKNPIKHKLIKKGKKVINYFCDFIYKFLISNNKLPKEDYDKYNEIISWVYFRNSFIKNSYSILNLINEIQKDCNNLEIYTEELKNKFNLFENEHEKYNIKREIKMGNIIAEYSKEEINMAIVGASHIRDKSNIISILEKKNISYWSVNIKNQNKDI